MKHKYSFLLAVALICSSMVLVSCRSTRGRRTSSHKHEHVYVQGPPPHAPAHGYRHKHQGVELVYDSGLGVYVVIELADHFYFKGHFYRHRGDRWEIGVHVGGPWEVVAEESLPKGLRSKRKGKAKPKGPPPHAPAHGYRQKYRGVDLVYDSKLGVYVLVELDDHFYFEGHYYRHGENQWEIGLHVDGPWEVVAEESLPKGLRSKKKGKGKGKGKGKPEKHPGKGLGLEKKKD